MFEREIRMADVVKRWTTVRKLQNQSLAEHSFYVAIYADQMAEVLNLSVDRGDLLRWALWHDMEETFTGDTPGPWKRRIRVVDAATIINTRLETLFGKRTFETEDKCVGILVKIANTVDEWLWLATERQMGNQQADSILWQDIAERCRRHVELLIPYAGKFRCGRLYAEIAAAAEDHWKGHNRYVCD